MTELIDERPSPLKGDLVERFSDADSGYEDPGVITVPVTRTVFHKDQRGRSVSTTSTEWISVPKSCERDDLKTKSSQSLVESVPREGLTKTPSSSLASLAFDEYKTNSIKSPLNVSQESESNSKFSLDLLSPNGVSTSPNLPLDNFNFDNFDFDISRFFKEHSKENESERRLRFLSTPRDKRGRGRPTIREINNSNKMVFREETTRRTPRRKIRSKSADSAKRIRGPQSMFSPIYTKVLSPETMKNRKMWADIVRKDCILEEEYYKVPYEACNREIILGRCSSSETLLNNFKRLKKERSSDGYVGNYFLKNNSFLPDSFTSPFGNNVFSREAFSAGNINNSSPGSILPFSFKPGTLGELQPQPPEPVFQKEPSTEATDQLKQLIDDLNLISCDTPNPAQENEYENGRNNKLSLETFEDQCSNEEDLSNPDSDSGKNDSLENFKKVNGDCDNDTQDNKVHHSIKQGRKKKAKKKVSFSNENEELIFDLAFSDSDSSSSVFEDRINEADSRAKKPTHLNDELYLQSNDISDHDSFVKDLSVPHALNSFNSNKCSEKGDSRSAYELNNNNESRTQFIANNDCAPNFKSDISCNENLIRVTQAKANNSTLAESLSNNKNRRNENTKIAYPLNRVKSRKIDERPLNNFNANLFGFYSNSPSNYTRENDLSEKKTNSYANNLKGDKVNIYMTKGPSFTEHQIHLITHNSNRKPNISVSRIRVPFSSIREQWDWALLLQHQKYQNQLQQQHKSRGGENENLMGHEKMIDRDYSPSPPSPFPRTGAFSPTSSCRSDASSSASSSGCFSDPYSPPSSPFKIGKGTFPTSL